MWGVRDSWQPPAPDGFSEPAGKRSNQNSPDCNREAVLTNRWKPHRPPVDARNGPDQASKGRMNYIDRGMYHRTMRL